MSDNPDASVYQRINTYDSHHIFYTKRNWNVGYNKILRNFYYCRVSIPRDTLHHLIHTKVKSIPAPRGCNSRFVLDNLVLMTRFSTISEADSIEKRLAVLVALFDCLEPATTDALQAQLDVVRSYYKDSP